MSANNDLMYIYHDLKGLDYDIYGLFKAICPERSIKIFCIEAQESFEIKENLDSWIMLTDKNTIKLKYLPKNGNEIKSIHSFAYEMPQIGLSFKSYIKKELYFALSGYYGRELPWGTLTGIRPVKLIASIMNTAKSNEEVSKLAYENYFISESKARLAIDIAERQQSVMSDIAAYTDDSYSLYISIPFCSSICSYCSFPSGLYAKAVSFIDEYFSCLCRELKLISDKFGRKPVSVYIGGGTPSAVDNVYLIQLFDSLLANFDMKACREVTFEAGRPDSISRELFDAIKAYPVSRLSINPQTMNDSTLKAIGRNHSSTDVIRAFELAIKNGYDNINSDIILGLPDESEKELEHTLDELFKMPLKGLTVHSLSIKKGSKLRENSDSYNYIINKSMDRMNDICMDYVYKHNMLPYYLYRQKNIAGNLENTGYSVKGYEGLYNILILEDRHNIIGAGAGAVSKLVNLNDGSIARQANIKDAKLYINRFNEMIEKKAGLV